MLWDIACDDSDRTTRGAELTLATMDIAIRALEGCVRVNECGGPAS
jgi:hypothetical protein